MTETWRLVLLERVKRRLAIDFDDDDLFLDGVIYAARQVIEGWVGPFDELVGEDGALPDCLIEAAGMLVGHWYVNREASGPPDVVTLPMGFHDLIEPYRKWEF